MSIGFFKVPAVGVFGGARGPSEIRGVEPKDMADGEICSGGLSCGVSRVHVARSQV
jgi:hypothetical protein